MDTTNTNTNTKKRIRKSSKQMTEKELKETLQKEYLANIENQFVCYLNHLILFESHNSDWYNKKYELQKIVELYEKMDAVINKINLYYL